MKKFTLIITLFLSSLAMMCFLTACNGSFFETPSQEPTSTDNPEVTLKEEANLTDNAQIPVSDETWNTLAVSYANLENDYQSLKQTYEADPLRANPDVDTLLAQANELIRTMGETKRSQISESDALELQQVIITMDESVNELYENIIHEATTPGEEDTESQNNSEPRNNDANNSSTNEPEQNEDEDTRPLPNNR